jgi:hypothetical protein
VLVVRQDQLESLGLAQREQFVRELAGEVADFASRFASLMGAEGCLALARHAERTAYDHGFELRSSARMFMQLMCTLGCDFLWDPQLPWASEVLEHAQGRPEEARAARLHRRALAYLDEVHGPGQAYLVGALRRISSADDEATAASTPDVESFCRLAEQMFPEKHAYVRRQALEAIYRAAAVEAQALELGSAGVLVLAGLAFALGSGVTRDPCYPWIARTLHGPHYGEGPQRTVRLKRRVLIYARHVASYLTGADDAQA